ncbi:MAG: 2-C-methyl-D-erythritol 4-phosphate cytidylyltransferase [Lachnospiraceae bacterium]|nr:2-C-methyl-D-erythritol 4-phosphate cytidylyltransferase [Lachnospiraceae bacterium]
MKVDAIVLAGGKGRRMGGSTPKQYLDLCGKPVLYYSLKAFEDSFIDNVTLVCGEGEEDYCRKEIVIKYGLTKVNKIVAGGKERYDSVYAGLMADNGCNYVYIHDGARPLVTQYILERLQHYVEKYGAAVAASPAKDTIKIDNGDGFIKSTPDRSSVWLMQTPQVFEYPLIRDAYQKLMDSKDRLKQAGVSVTDDTMVAKMFGDVDARLVENPESNLKITTPEDMIIAEALLRKKEEN